MILRQFLLIFFLSGKKKHNTQLSQPVLINLASDIDKNYKNLNFRVLAMLPLGVYIYTDIS